jgi:uncharacterized RDD family membrane protein YckC
MSNVVPAPAPRCPRCGGEMRPDSLAGLCPACLLAAASEPVSDVTGAMTTLTPFGASRAPSAGPGASAPLAPGQDFGPYRIVRLLGRGGMGEVYEAEQIEQGRRVALKILSQRLTDPHDRARFLREGQLAASINHPHSVYIFGSEEIAGTPVIAMELLAGGTLKDRVREQGPLPPAAAVDAILQIIAGLDAAQAGGILHRDIKPANCFTDREGTVKVGDFGLSISTMARDVSQLTASGTFQGTPAFAAPEQLKGEPLDVRSDIYAVGATLYYLLTGQPPFDDTDLLALLTRIATQAPRSPRALQPRVPRGLATVVLQCLAKNQAARPATYAALHEALRPFGSAAPSAATLGPRFAAVVIDQVLVVLFVNIMVSVVRITSVQTAASGWSALPVTALVMGAYFTLTEGLAGASIGKWIFGLRVTDAEGGRPGLLRAGVRAAIFVLASRGLSLIPNNVWIGALVSTSRPDPITAATIASVMRFVSVLRLLAPFALFLTARPRHGFAGIHELISGTRVTSARETKVGQSWNARRDQLSADQTRVDAPGLPTRGPFVLLEPVRTTASATAGLGFDPALKRLVWLQEAPVGTPLSDAARRDLARPGRLRWLAGQQEPNGTWEAFEAPQGVSLLPLATTKQPWRTVRQWLADLAEELVLCQRDGDVPVLALDRVWITTSGRAVLLDFPPPGVATRDATADSLTTEEARSVNAFLGNVAWSALAGHAQRASDVLPITEPPLPQSGTAVLRALRQSSREHLHNVSDLCTLALHTPAHVTRRSRAFVPALVAAMLGLLIIYAASGHSTWRLGVDPDQHALFNGLAGIERLRRSGASESDAERRALEIYTAGRYAPLSARPSSFDGPYRPYRRLANDIAARHPTVSDADLLGAIKQLGRDRLERLNSEPADSAWILAARQLPSIVTVLGLLSLPLAFVLRGGLTLRLFRLAVVDGAGAEVARWRALVRAAIVWMPWIGLPFLALSSLPPSVQPSTAWVAGAVFLVITVGMCWAIVDPARGLQDRIAGTWLVPR